jgi:hypothetical protein
VPVFNIATVVTVVIGLTVLYAALYLCPRWSRCSVHRGESFGWRR